MDERLNIKDIHACCLQILAETGLLVKNRSILTRLLEREVRCDVERGLIFFKPSQVETALARAPKRIVLGARNPDQIIDLTVSSACRFTPSGTGVAVIDAFSQERRPSLSTDVEQLVAVQQRLTQVDIARPMVTATDRPPHMSDLFECLTAFRHTTKHIMHRVNRPENVTPLLEMVRVVADACPHAIAHPPLTTVYCPISPLSFAPDIAQTMLDCAAGGLPVCVLSMAIGGGTAPATVMGQIMLCNAEIIGGIALIQTLHPGTPVLYGSVSSVMDMSTTILALGAPERGAVNGGLARLAHWYGIPSLMGGLSTDSKFMDFQAGFEKALTAVPLLNYSNILFGLGNMNSANTYSVGQLVADADLVDALKALIPQSPDTDTRNVCDLIKRVGPGGHYLVEDHTLTNFRKYWRPALFNRSTEYTSADSADVFHRHVQARTQALLAEPTTTVTDPRTDRELERILKFHEYR